MGVFGALLPLKSCTVVRPIEKYAKIEKVKGQIIYPDIPSWSVLFAVQKIKNIIYVFMPQRELQCNKNFASDAQP